MPIFDVTDTQPVDTLGGVGDITDRNAIMNMIDNIQHECAIVKAYFEAAEDEVTDVIDGAIEDDDAKDIEDLSMAGTEVKDADVSDDPDKLVYDPDSYTNDYLGDDKKDGEVDIDIQGTEEAAMQAAVDSIFAELGL